VWEGPSSILTAWPAAFTLFSFFSKRKRHDTTFPPAEGTRPPQNLYPSMTTRSFGAAIVSPRPQGGRVNTHVRFGPNGSPHVVRTGAEAAGEKLVVASMIHELPAELLVRVCSHLTYRDGLAVSSSCARLRESISTKAGKLLSEWRAQAWILDKAPALQVDVSCKLSWDALKRVQLDVEALREGSTASPPPNGATAFTDFTITVEGVLLPAPDCDERFGPVSEHSDEERLARLIGYLDQDALMDDNHQRCQPPLGTVRSWIGTLSTAACEAHPGFAVDGVYFGDSYANEYVGTFTLLRIFLTTPALETVKLYEGHAIECEPTRYEDMGIWFQNPALPYAHGDGAGEWRSELRNLRVIVENSEVQLSVEELGADDFLSYLRGEAIYS
jgi:hypothetical protein